MSLKRKEQGAHDRASAAEHEFADACAEAEAADQAAQRAQHEAAEREEELQAQAVAAREQAEDLRDQVEALESQLQEKASAASRRIKILQNYTSHCYGAWGTVACLCCCGASYTAHESKALHWRPALLWTGYETDGRHAELRGHDTGQGHHRTGAEGPARRAAGRGD